MIYFILKQYGGITREAIALILIEVVAIGFSLVIHEMSHAWAAHLLGDQTAARQGRLSMNPLNHLDPVGSLMLLLVGFGYAKPVPVNPRNLKNPRRDYALISLAGPVSNLLLAFLGALGYVLVWRFAPFTAWINPHSIPFVLALALEVFILTNLGLALFNLIPLPPLDGSNILGSLLPPQLAAKYWKVRLYTPYIFGAIILLSWLASANNAFARIDDILWYPLTASREWLANVFVDFWAMLFG